MCFEWENSKRCLLYLRQILEPSDSTRHPCLTEEENRPEWLSGLLPVTQPDDRMSVEGEEAVQRLVRMSIYPLIYFLPVRLWGRRRSAWVWLIAGSSTLGSGQGVSCSRPRAVARRKTQLREHTSSHVCWCDVCIMPQPEQAAWPSVKSSGEVRSLGSVGLRREQVSVEQ